MDPVIRLRNERWSLEVLPGTGAALAAGQIRTAAGEWVDLLRPTPSGGLHDPEQCASFPLLPWSNRIRDGVLEFGGRRWQLQRNGVDGSAIHGAARQVPWQAVDRDGTSVLLRLDSGDVVGTNFPWRFRAEIGYRLAGDTLAVDTRLENADGQAFPAGFGHHPYFVRALGPGSGAGRGGPVLGIPAARMYLLDAGLADAASVPVDARCDFRVPRPVGSVALDDALTDLEPGVPIRWRYPDRGVEVTMTCDPVYSHVVVYAPAGAGHLAIEPVTHVNGGLAMHERGVAGTGVFLLEPGGARAGQFTVSVTG